MDSGIYKITSISNPDRIYVGSAQHLKKRQQQHLNQIKRGTHPNFLIVAHVKKHSLGDLKFDTIEKCSIDSLLIREQFFIDTINPSFNICKIAGNTIGRPQSEETKKKRALKLKGRVMSDEAKHLMHLARAREPMQKINSFVLIACGLFGENGGCKKNHYKCENCGIIRFCAQHDIKRSKCKCQIAPKIRKPKAKKIRQWRYNVSRKDNTSGFPGVTWDRAAMIWRAKIKHNGKLLDAGRYPTAKEAHLARQQKLIEMKVPIRPIAV